MKIRRVLAFIMVLVMCIGLLPVNIPASETETSDSEASVTEGQAVTETQAEPEQEDEPVLLEDIISEETYLTEVVSSGENGDDNDELFAGYVDQLFNGAESASGAGMRKAAPSAYDGLSEVYRKIYDDTSAAASEIAAGQRASTVIEFTFVDLGISKSSVKYSAADLGVSEIVSGSSITTEASEAMKAKLGELLPDKAGLALINRVLLAEHPYELYWYDKTAGCASSTSYSYGAEYSDGEYFCYFSDSSTYKISYSVAEAYAGAEAYTVDISIAQTASAAAANAQTVVTQYSSLGDYDKLESYKDWICSAVSYNNEAADEQTNTPYGNPWQLIWVFDNDDTTNVVCEGYSKAFKYLCDKSDFNSDDISCITVSGTMSGGTGAGRHMWNIVTMDDQRNYLVDVTNCDEGTVGADDLLFIVPYSSTGEGTYSFYCNGTYMVYEYDAEMTDLYGAQAVAISQWQYIPPATSGSCGDNVSWTFADGVLTLSGGGETYSYREWISDGYVYTDTPWRSLYNQITEVVVGDGITGLGYGLFHDCVNITKVTIPESISWMGEQAFADCTDVTDIYYGGSLLKWFNDNIPGSSGISGTVHPSKPSTGTCGDSLTWTLDTDGNMVITGSGQMYDRPEFTILNAYIYSLTLPDGLTNIGESAFEGAAHLSAVTFPDSLQSVGACAFRNCSLITAVRFPGEHDTFTGCESIGANAFEGCSSLESVYIHKSMDSIGESAFDNCHGNLTITYENSVLGWIMIEIAEPNAGIDNAHIVFEIELKGNCGDNVIWELRNDLVLFISGTGDMWDVQNKEERYWHDFRNYIRTAVIDEGVTNIGAYTFADCSILRSVSIASTVEDIDAYAFENCQRLSSFHLPETVMNIGTYAFHNSSITEITGAEGLKVIDDYAFYECRSLMSLPAMDSLTLIGKYAFAYCSLSDDFTVPAKVRQIQEGTFYYSGIRNVTITSNVRSIGDNAFYYCRNLASVSVDAESKLTSVGNYTFYGCSSLNNIDFNNATLLESLGYDSFADCTSLTGWYMPDSITTIGDYAFAYDTALSEIDLPNKLTAISSYMFEGCSSLVTVIIEENVTSIGYSAFRNCTSLESIILPSSLQSIDGYAFYSCSKLSSIELPEAVSSIGEYAFAECRRLSSVTFDDALQSIGYYAFNNCTNLTAVILPPALTYIADGAFKGCTAVRTVTFSDSLNLTRIGASAFANCSRISNIVIPVGVTSIGDSAFYSCYNIEEITLPVTLQTIGNQAFDGCSSLFDVYYGGTEEVWNLVSIGTDNDDLLAADFHFGEVLAAGRCGDDLFAVLTPDGVLTVTGSGDMWDLYNENWGSAGYEITGTSPWSTFASQVTAVMLPQGLTSIGGGAFIGCKNLEELTIPEGVTNIGKYVFKDCDSLKTVTIPKSVTSLYEDGFSGCDVLTDIYYTGSALDFSMYLSGLPYYLSDSVELHAALSCSGSCGTNISWELTTDGTLTVSGTGGMFFDDYNAWREQISWFIRKVVVEDGITNVGQYAFQNCTKIIEVILPESVTSIGYYAFYNCKGLISIEIPASVGSYAFYDCTSLKTVTFFDNPAANGGIDNHAFYGCAALDSLAIPKGVSYINEYAFADCSSIENVVIPESLSYFYGNSFENCTSLKSISTIGHNTSIDGNGSCISGLDSLTDVYFAGTEHMWKYHWDHSVYFPESVTVHYGTYSDIQKYEAVAPTCMSEGHEEYWYCHYNGSYFKDSEGLEQVNYEDLVINQVEHDIVTEVIAPTCTEQGYTHTYCRYGCGYDEYTDYKDALGHDWGEGEVIHEPTCSEWGTRRFTCSRCGETYEENIEPTYNHTWGEWTVSTEPTCMSEGYRYHHCEVCGTEESESIPTVDHDLVSEIVAPTCTGQGYTHTYCRYGCGYDEYTDYKDALGHDWGEGEVIHEPTCSEWGTKRFTCSRCGETYEESIEPTYNHTWSEWTVDQEPTCMSEGLRHRHCEVCGTEEPESIPMLDHDLATEEKAPTCTEQGYIRTYCRYGCGYDEYEYVEALGHDYVYHAEVPATSEAEGMREHYRCSRCGSYFDIALGQVEEWTLIIDKLIDINTVSVRFDDKQENIPNESSGHYWTYYDGSYKQYSLYLTRSSEGIDELIPGVDYTVAYSNNRNVGTASITITGIGRFCGTLTIPLMICFKDVPYTHNFRNAVYWAVDKGIAAGYSGAKTGIFGVGDDITRGQVAMFLWRAAGKPEPQSSVQRFTDVPKSNNFFMAIQWAAEQGIAGGYSGARKGQFGPSDNCTRGQIAMFLWRAAGKPEPESTTQKFTDVPSSNNFFKAIQWAAENGITAGYSDGTFGVNRTCTRGHCVTFLYRMDQKGFLK